MADTAIFITLAFVGTTNFVPIMILYHFFGADFTSRMPDAIFLVFKIELINTFAFPASATFSDFHITPRCYTETKLKLLF